MTKDIGIWHVPFRGRNRSGTFRQNFLWQHNNVYVMDNHRAAMWCWLRHIAPNNAHSLFHIDRHTDTLQSQLDTWRRFYPSDWRALSINDYLDLKQPIQGMGPADHPPLIRWDNYLSIYLDVFSPLLKRCIFATHDCGDEPNYSATMKACIWELPENIDYWLKDRKEPVIMNIDIDYFFAPMQDDEPAIQFVSDATIAHFMDVISKRVKDGTIAVTTICLTPDAGYTGGWTTSERLMELMLSKLNIDFKLNEPAARSAD